MIEFPLKTEADIEAYDASVEVTRACLGLTVVDPEIRVMPAFTDAAYPLIHPTMSEWPFVQCHSFVPSDLFGDPRARFFPCPCGKVLWKLPPYDKRTLGRTFYRAQLAKGFATQFFAQKKP